MADSIQDPYTVLVARLTAIAAEKDSCPFERTEAVQEATGQYIQAHISAVLMSDEIRTLVEPIHAALHDHAHKCDMTPEPEPEPRRKQPHSSPMPFPVFTPRAGNA